MRAAAAPAESAQVEAARHCGCLWPSAGSACGVAAVDLGERPAGGAERTRHREVHTIRSQRLAVLVSGKKIADGKPDDVIKDKDVVGAYLGT